MPAIMPYWTDELPESFYYPYGKSNNPWDIVLVNAGSGWKRIPGICSVKVSSSQKLDKKQAAGKQFATLTTEGYVPCDVIITVTLISPGDWRDWQTDIAPLARPTAGAAFKKTPKALSIIHPATMAADIEGVTFENVEGPDEGHIKGTRVYRIKCVQWSPEMQAKGVTETAKGVITAPTNPKSVLSPEHKPSHAPIPAHHE